MPYIPEKEFNLILKTLFNERMLLLQMRIDSFGNTLKYHSIQLLLII